MLDEFVVFRSLSDSDHSHAELHSNTIIQDVRAAGTKCQVFAISFFFQGF